MAKLKLIKVDQFYINPEAVTYIDECTGHQKTGTMIAIESGESTKLMVSLPITKVVQLLTGEADKQTQQEKKQAKEKELTAKTLAVMEDL